VVQIAGARAREGITVIATPDAIALAEYLISLNRQYPVADSLRATDRHVTGGGAGGAHD
jgi:hypothetical protein